MSDHTYNTDHGVFLIKKENVPACIEAVMRHVTEPDPADKYMSPLSDREKEQVRLDPPDITDALGFVGLGCGESENGDVIDIYLEEGSFPGVEYTLTNVIAPFVEPGSFLVFAYGGASGCWSVEYTKDPETGETFGNVGDVVVVRHDDMLRMLLTLKSAGLSLFHQEMQKRYGAPDAAE